MNLFSGHHLWSFIISVQLSVVFLLKALKVVQDILGDNQMEASQLMCIPSCLLTGSG